jgi:hypothetical protein
MAYDAFLTGKLSDHELPAEEIKRALNDIAALPRPHQFRMGSI